MICPNCGTPNSDDVSQCTFCGQRFAPKDPPPESNENSSETSGADDYYTAGQNNTAGGSAQWQNNQSWNGQPNNQNNSGWNNQPNNQGNAGWNNQSNYQNWNHRNYQNNQSWNGQNQPPYWQNQPPKQPADPLAITSMVVGIISIFFLCILPYLSLPLDIVGIVLGIIALKKKQGGKGMAIAGIIISAVILVASILILIMVAYLMSSPDFMHYFNEFYNLKGLWIK